MFGISCITPGNKGVYFLKIWIHHNQYFAGVELIEEFYKMHAGSQQGLWGPWATPRGPGVFGAKSFNLAISRHFIQTSGKSCFQNSNFTPIRTLISHKISTLIVVHVISFQGGSFEPLEPLNIDWNIVPSPTLLKLFFIIVFWMRREMHRIVGGGVGVWGWGDCGSFGLP